MTRPECYKCKHRGEVPGSCHSRCNHPLNASVMNSPIGNIIATFASVQRVPPTVRGHRELNIRGSAHGIKNGWFNYPWNFDPIWLENCNGFEEG